MNLNILHALKEVNHSIFIIAGREKKDIKTIVENECRNYIKKEKRISVKKPMFH